MVKKIFAKYFHYSVGYINNISTFAPALQHKFFDGLQASNSGVFIKQSAKTLKIRGLNISLLFFQIYLVNPKQRFTFAAHLKTTNRSLKNC
jgi:hypothetical protein